MSIMGTVSIKKSSKKKSSKKDQVKKEKLKGTEKHNEIVKEFGK